MNFKRPYWLMLLISIGIMGIGYAAFMLAQPDKAGPVIQWLILAAGELLMLIGTISFLVSLIWCFVSDAHLRKHQPKR